MLWKTISLSVISLSGSCDPITHWMMHRTHLIQLSNRVMIDGRGPCLNYTQIDFNDGDDHTNHKVPSTSNTIPLRVGASELFPVPSGANRRGRRWPQPVVVALVFDMITDRTARETVERTVIRQSLR